MLWLPGSLIALLRDHRGDPAAPQIEQKKEAPVAVPEPPPAHPEPDSIADPNVAVAFAAGWQMTELYQCARRIRKCGMTAGATTPPDANGLACLRELDASERGHLALDEIGVALFKLRGRFATAALEPPTVTDLAPLLASSNKDDGKFIAAVSDKHDELLGRLGAADFRLGKAYRLGVQLAQVVLGPEEPKDLDSAFGSRAVSIRTALADLASVFPDHASRSVSISLRTWELWASDPEIDEKPVDSANWAAVRSSLRRQGKLWRSLLSGEKCGEDMLSTSDYVTAAKRLVNRASRMLLSFSKGLVVLLLIALVGGILLAFFASDDSLRAIGGPIVALAGVVGLTGVGARARASRLAKRLEEHLWAAQMDESIAAAITTGPHGWGKHVTDVNLPAAGGKTAAAHQIA